MSWRIPWPGEKPFKMVWRVERDARRSYLAGTAHFFPCSYSRSLSKIVQAVDTVLTEGPLDEASLERIAEAGRDGKECAELGALLDPAHVREIDRLLADRLADRDEGAFFFLVPSTRPNYFEVFTRNVRPWMALFSIWTTYLDWKFSVDLEVYRIAVRMGKRVECLETLDEQIEVLNNIPLERVLRQLGDVKSWETYKDSYERLYKEGKLEELVAFTGRFPTRTPASIGERDCLMFQRMRPVFERGPAAAFIGFPHVPGVIQLLVADGYRVTQGFA